MNMIKYITLFILIQIVSLVLTVVGIPVCAYLAYFDGYTYHSANNRYHWSRKWAWLWDNEEDGVLPHWYQIDNAWSRAHAMFMWSALRNPVNNLRFVPGVAQPSGPLWYRTWFWFGKQFYYKFGFLPHNGYPAFSAGSGRGY